MQLNVSVLLKFTRESLFQLLIYLLFSRLSVLITSGYAQDGQHSFEESCSLFEKCCYTHKMCPSAQLTPGICFQQIIIHCSFSTILFQQVLRCSKWFNQIYKPTLHVWQPKSWSCSCQRFHTWCTSGSMLREYKVSKVKMRGLLLCLASWSEIRRVQRPPETQADEDCSHAKALARGLFQGEYTESSGLAPEVSAGVYTLCWQKHGVPQLVGFENWQGGVNNLVIVGGGGRCGGKKNRGEGMNEQTLF